MYNKIVFNQTCSAVRIFSDSSSSLHSRQINSPEFSLYTTAIIYNPLWPTAIQKLLEMIGRVHLYPRLFVEDWSRLRHKPDYRHGWSSEYVRKSMHACQCVCCVQASRKAPATRQNGSIHRSILVGLMGLILITYSSQVFFGKQFVQCFIVAHMVFYCIITYTTTLFFTRRLCHAKCILLIFKMPRNCWQTLLGAYRALSRPLIEFGWDQNLVHALLWQIPGSIRHLLGLSSGSYPTHLPSSLWYITLYKD